MMLAKHIELQQPSATLMINERTSELIRQGRDIVRFGFGQSPFPVPEVVVERLRQNAHQKDYLDVAGLLALREKVAEFYNQRDFRDYTAEEVIMGPGSKELIFLAQLCLDATLLLPKPSWVSYGPQAQILMKEVRWIETRKENDWMMTAGELEEHCKNHPAHKPHLLILNYPNNPVGASYESHQIEAIAKVCRQHRIIVISDEIYGETHHEGHHVSLARYYPEGTVILGGMSKWCGAGGWRLGHFCIPKELKLLRSAMRMAASETFTSVSAPIQYAAVSAYSRDPSIELYKQNSRKILHKVANYVYSGLTERIECTRPKGGFYLQVSFDQYRDQLRHKGISTSLDLCESILNEAGVALLPGTAFGFDQEQLHARLSFVDFDGQKLLSEADKFIDNRGRMDLYCPRIVQGVNKLNEWIEKDFGS